MLNWWKAPINACVVLNKDMFVTGIFLDNILFSLNKWAHLLLIGVKSGLWLLRHPAAQVPHVYDKQLVIYRALKCAVLLMLLMHIKTSLTGAVVKTAVWNAEANALYAHSGLGFSLYAMIDFFLRCSKIRWFCWQMINFMKFIFKYFIECMCVCFLIYDFFCNLRFMLQSGIKTHNVFWELFGPDELF